MKKQLKILNREKKKKNKKTVYVMIKNEINKFS